MIVTNVAVRKVANAGNFLGSASVTLDGAVIINDCKIMNGKNGKFVSLPERKGKDDKYYNVVWVVDNRLREEMTAKILEEFDKAQ